MGNMGKLSKSTAYFGDISGENFLNLDRTLGFDFEALDPISEFEAGEVL